MCPWWSGEKQQRWWGVAPCTLRTSLGLGRAWARLASAWCRPGGQAGTRLRLGREQARPRRPGSARHFSRPKPGHMVPAWSGHGAGLAWFGPGFGLVQAWPLRITDGLLRDWLWPGTGLDEAWIGGLNQASPTRAPRPNQACSPI